MTLLGGLLGMIVDILKLHRRDHIDFPLGKGAALRGALVKAVPFLAEQSRVAAR